MCMQLGNSSVCVCACVRAQVCACVYERARQKVSISGRKWCLPVPCLAESCFWAPWSILTNPPCPKFDFGEINSSSPEGCVSYPTLCFDCSALVSRTLHGLPYPTTIIFIAFQFIFYKEQSKQHMCWRFRWFQCKNWPTH